MTPLERMVAARWRAFHLRHERELEAWAAKQHATIRAMGAVRRRSLTSTMNHIAARLAGRKPRVLRAITGKEPA